ncbi:MAG: metal-dependent hydrolase [bacterium]|nr:metal-dependent hydrolase [bacterium]
MALPTGHLAVGAATFLHFPKSCRRFPLLIGLVTLANLPDFDLFFSLFDHTLPFTHHRNFFHSWWFIIAVSLLVALSVGLIKKSRAQAKKVFAVCIFLLGTHLLFDLQWWGSWRHYDVFAWDSMTWGKMIQDLTSPLGLRMALEDFFLFGTLSFLFLKIFSSVYRTIASDKNCC